jgi:hypothetical protein
MKLRKFLITIAVILVLGILPVIPMQYTPVVEHPGPARDILASFFQMFVYIFAGGSGAFYSFTPGSLITIAVLFVIGWLLRRFLFKKFAQEKKESSNA